ncbi:hypothetical protein NDU88_001623 [Pleurodeles waltl]|uniref:Uncharacterized protein n=1 Tax=Pleurodeles waltl TaxID=8319 RepID=A0AAV7SZR8_PLEWA|nr:hypothetical protein NDU88_001623 [Pleurodeles waltl]
MKVPSLETGPRRTVPSGPWHSGRTWAAVNGQAKNKHGWGQRRPIVDLAREQGKRERLLVQELRQDSGNGVTGSDKVAEVFADFMQDFYNARPLDPEAEVLDFIKDCPVKYLRLEHRKELEGEVTLEEIALAMGQIQAGKAPGPKGYL